MKLTYRLACETDLIDIVRMLSDDELGAAREAFRVPLPTAYLQAFQRIVSDTQQELTVVEAEGKLIATFHLSFIQYLTYQGGTRAQIEAVRVKSGYRGQGIGTEIFEYASQRAKARGAHVLQLTTDKKRPEAKRFYESLGFVASHDGMKLHLDQ